MPDALSRFRPGRTPALVAGLAILSVLLQGCPGDGGASSEGTRSGAPPSPGEIGSFELDGASHVFQVRRCDLSGASDDGMLVRGTGTTPDGRRISVEVERLQGGDVVWERATVYFGSILDGDHWEARLQGWPDGRWFAAEAGREPVEGPLLRISGNELTVEGAFHHESDDTMRPGVLRVTCPE